MRKESKSPGNTQGKEKKEGATRTEKEDKNKEV